MKFGGSSSRIDFKWKAKTFLPAPLYTAAAAAVVEIQVQSLAQERRFQQSLSSLKVSRQYSSLLVVDDLQQCSLVQIPAQ